MDQKDEFSKWLDTVEEALRTESSLEEDMPPVPNQCGCGSWDCQVCFPEQNEIPGMNGTMDGLGGADLSCSTEICSSCGNPVNGHQHPEDLTITPGPNVGPDTGLEEMPSDFSDDFDDMDALEPMEAPMEEEPQHFDQLPRSRDGRGVKLGDIIQKTEYRKVGSESPLTYGSDNLDEEIPVDADSNEYGKAGRYAHDHFGNLKEYGDEINSDDPLAFKDYYDELSTIPKSEEDIAQMTEWVSSILHMQSQGLSKSPKVYDESDFAAMGPDQIKKIYQEVTGNMAEGFNLPNKNTPTSDPRVTRTNSGYHEVVFQGETYVFASELEAIGFADAHNIPKEQDIQMENIDRDVAAMIAALKSYDAKVAESKIAVKEDGEADKKNPWEKLAADKKDSEKTSKTHKGGTVTKTDSGLTHRGTYGGGKDDIKEDADPDVLSWMARFAKIPR